jgi:hypothetical protein
MAEKVTITNAFLRNLTPPPTGRVTYQCIKIPYLQLRVSSNGTKSFSIYRRAHDGKTERINVGRWPVMPLQDIQAQAAKINSPLSGACHFWTLPT